MHVLGPLLAVMTVVVPLIMTGLGVLHVIAAVQNKRGWFWDNVILCLWAWPQRIARGQALVVGVLFIVLGLGVFAFAIIMGALRP